MRKRFSHSLKWFGALENLVTHNVQQAIDSAREGLPPREPEPSDDAEPREEATASSYLRQRCPICFGKVFSHHPAYVASHITLFTTNTALSSSAPDIIVCADANFTQKRLKKKTDDPDDPDVERHHPDTAFLSRSIVRAVADRVQTLRTTGNVAPPEESAPGNDEDRVEPGMKVPSSVLDGCGSTFIAADEKREKASTKLFADTGLMALLCRHDRVLWLANVEESGEKQHYALALMEQLFKHLPPFVTVGLLYDINCQLHRSCVKWGFLAEFMPRLRFAISVFHAYGHQWACQVVYHPRKCIGFGLSDGESCERFWSMIKKLIAPLRVSGVSQLFFCACAR